DRLANVVHLVKTKRIKKSLHVIQEIIDRPDVIRPRIGGLAMATHITAEDPIVPGKWRHPVVPEARTAAKAVLDPHRLGWLPRIGKVIDLIVHLVVVGSDFGHTKLLFMRPSPSPTRREREPGSPLVPFSPFPRFPFYPVFRQHETATRR